jgi:hypothetical protein
MKKPIFNRGQEVIYIKGDILRDQLALKAYYLEECDDNSGRFYLTTNKEKVQTFDQKNSRIIFGDDVFIVSNYDKLRIFSDKIFSKYEKINKFLCNNFNTYHDATRFYLYCDDFQELYNVFGENVYKDVEDKQYYTHSKLCNNIIKMPCCYPFRFWFNILSKYFLGIFVHFFFLIVFFMDLVFNLYEGYYNYIAALHALNKYKKEIKLTHQNDVQERHNIEVIAKREKDVENKKEIYMRSNIAFFTLFLAVIVFYTTVVIHNKNMNRKDDEITTLKIKNEEIEQEIEDLKNSKLIEILENQNQINNDLVLTINQLKEIVNELKEEITEK